MHEYNDLRAQFAEKAQQRPDVGQYSIYTDIWQVMQQFTEKTIDHNIEQFNIFKLDYLWVKMIKIK